MHHVLRLRFGKRFGSLVGLVGIQRAGAQAAVPQEIVVTVEVDALVAVSVVGAEVLAPVGIATAFFHYQRAAVGNGQRKEVEIDVVDDGPDRFGVVAFLAENGIGSLVMGAAQVWREETAGV